MAWSELAWNIFTALKEAGADIGNMSVPIIQRELDKAQPPATQGVAKQRKPRESRLCWCGHRKIDHWHSKSNYHNCGVDGCSCGLFAEQEPSQ